MAGELFKDVSPLSVPVAPKQLLETRRDGHFETALKLVVLLNFADAVLTSWWVATGAATEANPLMAHVLSHGIGAFLVVKLLVGLTAAAILRAHSKHVLSRTGVAIALVAYLAVFGFHLSHGARQLTATGSLVATAR